MTIDISETRGAAYVKRCYAAVRFLMLLINLCLLNGCYNVPFGFFGNSESYRKRRQQELALTPAENQVSPFEQAIIVSERERAEVLPPPQVEINEDVKKHIRYFVEKDPEYISNSLKRIAEWYPTLRQILRDEGIPEEMLNVALIESRFNPNAHSRAGAVGLWQFMKGTARHYGLKVGFLKDERRDPVLSTIAAARLLRDLYNRYHDWKLVLAAYNAGSGTVDRAIRRAVSRDFWVLRKKRLIRGQPSLYVLRFLAVLAIMQNPEKYGFKSLRDYS
ncbi:MAG: lytic transglycosylase domain-containing protein [Candidatus Dadabacteria bacterium]|nr:MAG: lytic transglycosylase domain-containing protein [Candidatus Dadabacteria bacterium]